MHSHCQKTRKFSVMTLVGYLLAMAVALPGVAQDNGALDAPIAGQFRLEEGEVFAALDLSPDAQTLIISAAHPGYGRSVFARVDTLEIFDRVDTPPGLRLTDPRYNSDGTEILFAGTCRPENSPCEPEQVGWNIYRYDIAARTLLQLTTPMAEFGRRRPVWGPEDSVYFVGFNNRYAGSLGGSAAAVFRALDDGSSVLVFPRDSYSSRSNAIHAPIGDFRAIDLLSVDADGILFGSRYDADLTRPKNPEGDQRIIDFADKHFYSIPRDQWRDSSTYRTIFQVTPDELLIFLDPDRITGEVPNKEHIQNITMDGDVIWVDRRRAKKVGYGAKVSRIEGSHAELIDVAKTPMGYPFSELEVSGRHAIIVAQRDYDDMLLFHLVDWDSYEVFELGPKQN